MQKIIRGGNQSTHCLMPHMVVIWFTLNHITWFYFAFPNSDFHFAADPDRILLYFRCRGISQLCPVTVSRYFESIPLHYLLYEVNNCFFPELDTKYRLGGPGPTGSVVDPNFCFSFSDPDLTLISDPDC
jgi:hypothetical protein